MAENHEKAPKLFGTNGIRGVPNVDLTTEFSQGIGFSAGTFFSTERVAIARDTRQTGDMILSAVESGLMACGKNVIHLGILPTPALQYYCKLSRIYGVMITASHNPPQFNGIKCIDKDGTELGSGDEAIIEKIFADKGFKKMDWSKCGRIVNDNSAPDTYIHGILSHTDTGAISAADLRVAFDAGNGASFSTTPMLLSVLGLRTVTLNCNPDGKFTSRESEPKPENLGALISLVKQGGFDLGIAHDGDADRAVFIDEKGNFIDGDRMLSLIVKHVARRGDTVVTPVSSSDCISEICEKNGAKLVRTKVGAPVVSRKMIELKAAIGGEENGGIIYPAHQFCRDGAMTAALVLSYVAETGIPVSESISGLPPYFLSKKSLKVTEKWEKLSEKITGEFSGMDVDRTDGIKIINGKEWVLIRPSGTEPIIRIYAQGSSQERAGKLAEEYVSRISNLMTGNS